MYKVIIDESNEITILKCVGFNKYQHVICFHVASITYFDLSEVIKEDVELKRVWAIVNTILSN